ncbi:hypothetical protein vBValCWD615_44 [Vibrio phage vB_ValC_WD615]|nr:hypothetical protein vBValCWD615_44 [Vibrio phage vB_ValC_WD615]
MFLIAEEKFYIEFKDGSSMTGSSADGHKLTELDDRLMVECGNKRRVFFNDTISYYEIEKTDLDKTGMDLEIGIK